MIGTIQRVGAPRASRPTATLSGRHIPRKVVLRRQVNGAEPEWASGEHIWLGNEITLNFPGSGPVQAANVNFTLTNGAVVTYGQICALADFFGDPDKPISDDPTPERFNLIFSKMNDARRAPKKIAKLNKYMMAEVQAIATALKNGGDPSVALRLVENDFNEEYAAAIGRIRYLRLLMNNFDHFGEDAVAAWKAGHQLALSLALAGWEAGTLANQSATALQLLNQAYAVNAFADHFLTDLFSAGHLRTPRRALHKKNFATSFSGDECAHLMHDEDCYFGLNVGNGSGNWYAYGDTFMLDGKDNDNYQHALAAMQSSADEVWTTFTTGTVPSTYAALSKIPDLKWVRNWNDKRNGPALFIERGGKVEVRVPCTSRAYWKWMTDWDASDVAERYSLSKLSREVNPGEAASPLETDLLRVSQNPTGRRVRLERFTGLFSDNLTPAWGSDDLGSWPEGTASFVPIDFRGNGETSIVCIDAGRGGNGTSFRQISPKLGKSEKGFEVRWSREDNQPSSSTDLWLAVDRGEGCRQALAQVTNRVSVALWEPVTPGNGLVLVNTADDPLAESMTVLAAFPCKKDWGHNKDIKIVGLTGTNGDAKVYSLLTLVQTSAGFVTAQDKSWKVGTPATTVLWGVGDFDASGTDNFAWVTLGPEPGRATVNVYDERAGKVYSKGFDAGSTAQMMCFDIDGDGYDEIVVAYSDGGPEFNFMVWGCGGGLYQIEGPTLIYEGLGGQWVLANRLDAGMSTILQYWNEAPADHMGLIQYRSDYTQGLGVYLACEQTLGAAVPLPQIIPATRGYFPLSD